MKWANLLCIEVELETLSLYKCEENESQARFNFL